jgi:hypothetical protein
VTATYHVMWMLCALGAVSFAAAAAGSAARSAALAAGFAAAAAAVTVIGTPDAPVVGIVAAGAAAASLFRPGFVVYGAAAGGALAGLLPELLWLQGVPRWAAWATAVLVVGAPVWLARRRHSFAPQVIQDDALLVVMGLGVVLAVLPGVLDGWQAALALNMSGAAVGAAEPLPSWLVAAVMASLLVGAAHTVWSRR